MKPLRQRVQRKRVKRSWSLFFSLLAVARIDMVVAGFKNSKAESAAKTAATAVLDPAHKMRIIYIMLNWIIPVLGTTIYDYYPLP